MATTISISQEMKEKLKSFGRAGDSYEDVIRKMYEIARRQKIHEFLYDSSNSISTEEARKRLNGKSRNN